MVFQVMETRLQGELGNQSSHYDAEDVFWANSKGSLRHQ